MKAKIVVPLMLLLMAACLVAPVFKAAASDALYEHINTGDNAADGFGNFDSWLAQTFTVGASPHTITSVKIKAYRDSGSYPGVLTISIRATTFNGMYIVPTGEDLTSGTADANGWSTDAAGEWHEISVTSYTLTANTRYAILFRAASEAVDIRIEDSAPNIPYADGDLFFSSNEGANWYIESYQVLMFEVYGAASEPPAPPSGSSNVSGILQEAAAVMAGLTVLLVLMFIAESSRGKTKPNNLMVALLGFGAAILLILIAASIISSWGY